jgi:hypothetical protein
MNGIILVSALIGVSSVRDAGAGKENNVPKVMKLPTHVSCVKQATQVRKSISHRESES